MELDARPAGPAHVVAQALGVRIEQMVKNRHLFFALEFCPSDPPLTTENLIPVFDHFLLCSPICYSLTWKDASCTQNKRTSSCSDDPKVQDVSDGAPGDEPDRQYIPSAEPSIALANTMVNFCGLHTLLHISARLTESESIVRARLTSIKKIGVKSILVAMTHGELDMPEGQHSNEFDSIVDYVSFVRRELPRQDGFSLGITADIWNPDIEQERSISLLLDTVSSGIDFIVTSTVPDCPSFVKFVRDCRCVGIRCAILPKIDVCPNDAVSMGVSAPSKDRCVGLCTQIVRSGLATGFYFVTHNRRDRVEHVLRTLKLWPSVKQKRSLPWRQSPKQHRLQSESVRPIFWSTRVKSYLYRTSTWEQFPSFRWKENPKAANTFSSISDNLLAYHHWDAPKASLLNQWGHQLSCEKDVWAVFSAFLRKSKNPRTGCSVDLFPWCEEGALAEETSVIVDDLVRLNERGVLTINSQPAVNGAPSDHPVYGWGPSDGYIYQKAYLEFFIPSRLVGSLLTILRQYPRVNFHIVNKQSGGDDFNNHEPDQSIAVTWGVFVGREVMQPTVVDAASFRIWKNEAYDIWMKRWAVLYECETESFKLIRQITDSYSLVNIVDNDFQKNSCLFELIDKVFEYENRAYDARQIFAV